MAAIINNDTDDSIFYLLFQDNESIMFLFEPETLQIIDANNSACEFAGYTYDELLASSIEKLNFLSEKELHRNLIGTASEASNCFSFPFQLPTKDKAEAELRLFSNKTVLLTIKPNSVASQQSSRLEEELINKLKESEKEYKSLFEYSPISIWEEDFSDAKIYIESLKKNGVSDFKSYFENNPSEILKISSYIKILNINQETLKMFGVKQKEDIPLNLNKYFTEESLPVFGEELVTLIKGDTTFESSIPINSLEGERMVLDIKVSIIPGYEDTWEKVLVSFVNVTEQRKADRALKESEVKLRESNSAKDKFFSIIAHDLKSPFNSILGFANLLSEDFDKYETAKQKKILGYIYESANSAYKLFENLLTWSRSQSGTLDYNPEAINLFLNSVQVFDLVNQQATKKSITLQNEVPADLIVNTDNNMLSTIMRNLLTNSIKFTPREGVIELRAKTGTPVNGTNFIEISILDNGVGIPKEKLPQLFSISKSNSTSGTERESGTGLGLILCKEFIEKHGGNIWVESEEGKGSTFTFTIPAA